VAQYKDFKKSQRVKTIVNNSAADSHIFLPRHSPFLACITLNKYSEILNSSIDFRSNRIVTDYSLSAKFQ